MQPLIQEITAWLSHHKVNLSKIHSFLTAGVQNIWQRSDLPRFHSFLLPWLNSRKLVFFVIKNELNPLKL
jgi:hypothetical protein